METERHAHLVASCRTDQAVYLVEIKCRQLVHDNAHGDVLALPGIYAGNETVQNKGVQCPDNALHLRVVRYQQVTRILRVAHLQVEVVAVTMEYPVTLFGRQARGIDTQRTYHTFQLLHCLVFESRLERTEQWGYLVVGLQYLENGLVTLIQERQDMRHVRVFSQPVGRFNDFSALFVPHHTRWLPEFRFRVLPFLCVQFVSFDIIRLALVVHEEIDAGGEEVHSRGLEELVAATASLFLAFLQALQQRLRRLAGRSEVVDVFRLNGIYPAAVLHVHEINHVELAALGQLAEFLVFLVVVVQLRSQSRELIVIDHHCESLGRVLPDKRLDDTECLTRPRCSDYPRSTETVGYVGPAFTKFALVVISHRDIHAVRGLYQFLALLETLVLEVEAVLHQSLLEELGDVVQCDMHEDNPHEGSCHIEDNIQRQRIKSCLHRITEQPYGQH